MVSTRRVSADRIEIKLFDQARLLPSMPAPKVRLTNVEKSIENNMLWPPVVDALRAFVFRRDLEANGYELTWRLIHVWEAIAAVLVGAITSRLRSLGSDSAFLRCREHLHGRTWDPLTKSFNRSQGALDGSATRRLDLLWDVEGFDTFQSRFLISSKRFLSSGGLNLRALIASWKQICDVPQEITSTDEFKIRETFRHINTFRNRFAHVPFPFEEMTELSSALADVTEQLFSVEPKPWQSFPDDRIESPLCGAIDYRGRRLRGNMAHLSGEWEADEPRFVFPSLPNKKEEYVELWEAAPFVFVDSGFRPSVLTRLVSEANGVWEYTRFLAERNSVVRNEKPAYLAKLQVPTSAEYPVGPGEEEEEEARAVLPAAEDSPKRNGHGDFGDDAFDRALRNISNEEYEPAIDFFKSLVDRRPTYHPGWLRLGYSQRELAMRKRFEDPSSAADLLAQSITSLTKAAEHSYPAPQAQALYERSKAYYHRARFSEGEARAKDLEKAKHDAERAYALQRETRYETWIDYLAQHLPTAA
jgi:hypothetical protein